MKLAYLFLLSFLITYIATPLVMLLARKCNCIDTPGKRKVHTRETPRWGGVAFFLGVLPVVFFTSLDHTTLSYIVSAFLILVLGIVDDRVQLPWTIKFAGMLIATTIIIFGGHIAIHSIGNYGAWGKIELGKAAIPFTYFCIIGLTNAINLIDGLNGLAAGISLLGFLFIGIAALLKGNYGVAVISFAFAGSLTAFLRYNFPRARIFMGDSGSLFLGFSIAVSSILLTQNQNQVAPMFPVLVFLIPIFDALRVMFVRILNSKNPFHADKTHLHHLIIRKKCSPEKAVVLLWTLTFFLGCISLYLLKNRSMHFMFAAIFGILMLSLFADKLVRRKQYRAEQARAASPKFTIQSPTLITEFNSAPLFAHKFTGKKQYRSEPMRIDSPKFSAKGRTLTELSADPFFGDELVGEKAVSIGTSTPRVEV